MKEGERWLVLDCETTGLLMPSAAKIEEQPRIIELALVEVLGGNAMGRELSWLINPGCPLTEEITKITGLRDDDLKGAPTFETVLGKEIIPAVLGAHGLIAHNLPFDLGMLVAELKRIGKEHAFPYPPHQMCTVQEFIHLKGRRMKLTELYEEAFGRELKQTHRALDDAKALAEIVIKEGLIA